MHLIRSAAVVATAVTALTAGSVARAEPPCETRTSCVERGQPPVTNPEMPAPGPIGRIRWKRYKLAVLRVFWRNSAAADWYQVRITRLKVRLVREGGETKREYTPFPQPWVEVRGRPYRILGPLKAGERYRVQVRGVNLAGAGPSATDTYTVQGR